MYSKSPMLLFIALFLGLPNIAATQVSELLFLELSSALLSPVGAGARAAGQGFAFIGVADDATAASHNPGGLTQLERPEMSVVGSYFLSSEQTDGASLDFISVVFPPFKLLNRKIVASLQVQRTFQLRDSLDLMTLPETNLKDARLIYERDGDLFSISPAIAIQITRSFSVGVTFNIWPDLFDNGWTTDITLEAGDQRVKSTSDVSYEAFNITAGFLWKITSRFTLGGVFSNPYTATLTRHSESERTGEPKRSIRENLDLDLPLSYGLGLSARVSDLLTLSFDILWVHWSDFRLQDVPSSFFIPELPTDSGGTRDVVVVPEFRMASRGDTTSIRIGMEYLWLPPNNLIIPLRAGVFYDPEPAFDGIHDFFGFGLGAGIAIGRYLLDVAYTFRTGTRTQLVVADEDRADEDRVNQITTTVYEHNFIFSMIVHF